MVTQFPLIWFREDNSGGWSRLKIKLELHNLLLDGGLVPPSVSAIRDAVKDLVATCKAQGAKIPSAPSKAISFSALVKILEDLGVLSCTPDPQPEPAEADPILSAEHRANVSHSF